jgi:hypothetical protein
MKERAQTGREMYWKKKECVKTLQKAILAVAPSYFRVEMPDGNSQYGERIFAYELYHQMRIHFPSEHGKLHGEYRKGLRHVPELEDHRTYIPDLILHQSGTIDSNLLAIEIKTSAKLNIADLLDDIKKLEYYTNPRKLNFKMGVMIVTNFSILDACHKDTPKMKQVAEIVRRAPRIAIWNIASPLGKLLPETGCRSLDELDPCSLQIWRADNLACRVRQCLAGTGDEIPIIH